MFNHTYKAVQLASRGQIPLKTLFLLPTILCLFIFGWRMQEQAVYYWCIVLAPCIFACLTGAIDRGEKRDTQYSTYLTTNCSLQQIWVARVLQVIIRYLFMSLLLFLFVGVIIYVIPNTLTTTSHIVLITLFLALITEVWQVPFTLFLSYRFGFMFSIIVNTIAGNVFVLLCPGSVLNILNPYGNVAIILYQFMGIGSNGVKAEEAPVFDPLLCLMSIGLSLLFFVWMTMITAKLFSTVGSGTKGQFLKKDQKG